MRRTLHQYYEDSLKRKIMLKTGKYGLGVVVLLTLILSGCGYYFPHVYSGPAHVVYMPNWKNRTNKLGLDNNIYQSLARWFQKSQAIDLTKDKTKADLTLSGEIISIDLPSVSWDGVSDATSTKVKLTVRYSLKDIKTGVVLWDVSGKLYTADYSVKTASAVSDDQAIGQIIEDLSEDIYIGTLSKIRKQQQQKPGN
jgi:hypothetical protein